MESRQSKHKYYVGQKVKCITGPEENHPIRGTWPYKHYPYRGQILTISQIIIAPDIDGNQDVGLRFKEIPSIIGGDKDACFDHGDFVPYEEQIRKYDLSIFYAMLNPDEATIQRYKKEY